MNFDAYGGEDKSYLQVIAACRQSGKQFVDEDFPPQKSSLLNSGAKAPGAQWANIEWLRASDIPELNDEKEGRLNVFKREHFKDGQERVAVESVDPSDIVQGIVSNCYFMSALSVLAEFPERIFKLFRTDEINEQGVWCVQMYKNGKAQEIVLDDYIPCLR